MARQYESLDELALKYHGPVRAREIAELGSRVARLVVESAVCIATRSVGVRKRMRCDGRHDPF